jgi:hypothetical protein
MLACVLGRFDDAAKQFEAGLESDLRVGAKPSLARGQMSYALMLASRGQPNDLERAIGLVESARAVALNLGMLEVASRAAELREQFDARPVSAAKTGRRPLGLFRGKRCQCPNRRKLRRQRLANVSSFVPAHSFIDRIEVGRS